MQRERKCKQCWSSVMKQNELEHYSRLLLVTQPQQLCCELWYQCGAGLGYQRRRLDHKGAVHTKMKICHFLSLLSFQTPGTQTCCAESWCCAKVKSYSESECLQSSSDQKLSIKVVLQSNVVCWKDRHLFLDATLMSEPNDEWCWSWCKKLL